MASRNLKQSKVAKALLWLSFSRPEENAFQMTLVHQLDINQWHSDLERKFLCASKRGKEESTTCITLWASNTSCWLRSMNKRNVIHFSWVNKTFLSRRTRSHSVAFTLATFTFLNRFYFRWKCNDCRSFSSLPEDRVYWIFYQALLCCKIAEIKKWRSLQRCFKKFFNFW